MSIMILAESFPTCLPSNIKSNTLFSLSRITENSASTIISSSGIDILMKYVSFLLLILVPDNDYIH